MKIDKVIENLKYYRKTFGNIDVKISEYVEVETFYKYHRELKFKDCCLSVMDTGSDGLVLLINKK